ncbi:MAG: hypothetical protein VYD54_10315, partial [Bdellovibrionota bacterium]|nr:hypothetical protein [Bdellovibrionota bacterium]
PLNFKIIELERLKRLLKELDKNEQFFYAWKEKYPSCPLSKENFQRLFFSFLNPFYQIHQSRPRP